MEKLEAGQGCPNAASDLMPRIDGRDRPQLSIVIPVFNGGSTLEACLRALLCAAGPSREIIMVDDASQDNSVKIARELGIRPIQFRANRGCTDARNEGVKHARALICSLLIVTLLFTLMLSNALPTSSPKIRTMLRSSDRMTPSRPLRILLVSTAISSTTSPIRTRPPMLKRFGRV